MKLHPNSIAACRRNLSESRWASVAAAAATLVLLVACGEKTVVRDGGAVYFSEDMRCCRSDSGCDGDRADACARIAAAFYKARMPERDVMLLEPIQSEDDDGRILHILTVAYDKLGKNDAASRALRQTCAKDAALDARCTGHDAAAAEKSRQQEADRAAAARREKLIGEAMVGAITVTKEVTSRPTGARATLDAPPPPAGTVGAVPQVSGSGACKPSCPQCQSWMNRATQGGRQQRTALLPVRTIAP